MTLPPYQAFTEEEEVVYMLKLGLTIDPFQEYSPLEKAHILNLKIHMQRLQAPGDLRAAFPIKTSHPQSTCLCFAEMGRQLKQ